MNLVIFFVLSLINVILGSMRSILTVKSSKKVAVIINTVSYTFYAIVIRLISDQPIYIVIIFTAITNIIGVNLAITFIEKFKHDKLWVIDLSIKKSHEKDLIEDLESFNIPYSSFVVNNSNSTNYKLYSYTKQDTARINKIFEKHQGYIKYNVVETQKLV